MSEYIENYVLYNNSHFANLVPENPDEQEAGFKYKVVDEEKYEQMKKAPLNMGITPDQVLSLEDLVDEQEDKEEEKEGEKQKEDQEEIIQEKQKENEVKEQKNEVEAIKVKEKKDQKMGQKKEKIEIDTSVKQSILFNDASAILNNQKSQLNIEDMQPNKKVPSKEQQSFIQLLNRQFDEKEEKSQLKIEKQSNISSDQGLRNSVKMSNAFSRFSKFKKK